jgi:heat shock protein HslJ
MKQYLLLPALAFLIAAACNLPAALATGQAPAPASPPAAVQPSGNAGSPAELTGTTWNWIGFTSPNEQVAVESPESYSLLFQRDGTVTIIADCNNAPGSYQVQGGAIHIQVGTMTEVMCPSGSRSDQFIQLLGNAAAYSLQDGRLYIDLNADGGTMVLAPASTATTGNGIGDLQQALQVNPWQWIGFASPAGEYDIESPGNYLLTFHEDGTLDIKADCNTVSGRYSLDGIKMSIVTDPVTLAVCPAGSHSEEFLRYLGSVSIYLYQPGELFLNLSGDGGTMHLTPLISGN